MGEQSRQITPNGAGNVTNISNRLESLAGKNVYTPTSYKGGYSTPLSEAEKSTRSKMYTQTADNNPLYQTGSSNILATLRGDYMNPESNKYLSSTADEITRKAKEAYHSELDSGNTFLNKSGNLYSTSGNKLRGDATKRFGETLTSGLNDLYSQNYTNERGNQLSALNSAMSYSQLPFQQSQDLMGYAGLERGINDKNLAGEYADYNRVEQGKEAGINQEYNQLMSLLSGYPMSYDQYTPGRSAFQDASSIMTPLAMLMMM
jgi:hypothetical protein